MGHFNVLHSLLVCPTYVAAFCARVLAVRMLAQARFGMHETEFRLGLDILLAALEPTSLAAAMQLAVLGAADGTLLAVLVAASPAAAVRNAEIGLADRALGTVLDTTSLATSMGDAELGTILCTFAAVLLLAAKAAAVCTTEVRLPDGTLGALTGLAAPAAAVRYAELGLPHRTLGAVRLELASPAAAVRNAEPCAVLRALRTAWHLAPTRPTVLLAEDGLALHLCVAVGLAASAAHIAVLETEARPTLRDLLALVKLALSSR
jgi:hypothetical protein